MGLTVHYKLAAPRGLTESQAKKLVNALHRLASRFQSEGLVDKVGSITSDAPRLERSACDWVTLPVPGQENTFTGVEVLPVSGFIFRVSVGADCEPLWLGLCQYPRKIFHKGWLLPVKKGVGWRLSGFSKTQYASLHGWEHFQRCHCVVVNLLVACRSLGLRVTILDEGEYWPRRSLTKLRENVGHMNGLVAAAAGAMKDAYGAGENGIQSPIFAHKDFERLEAEGARPSALALEKLRALMRQF